VSGEPWPVDPEDPIPAGPAGPDPLAPVRDRLMAAGIADGELAPDPVAAFRAWFDLAVSVGVHEPEAAIVATADARGRPSARHVLVKEVDERGLAFYTNKRSRKGRELAGNPQAGLCFPWNGLARQVRVVGTVVDVGDDEADAYFATRPRTSQLGAWASPQSEVLAGRDDLDARLAEVTARFEGGEVPRPPHWGGYRLVPEEFELWQGRPSRLHDRFRYRRDDVAAGWVLERLAP
jgi:pyridoxamine 5'-phosphate oxidase